MTNTQFHDNENNHIDSAVNFEDALDCLRQRLGDSFPGSSFATEEDPVILAVAAMGSVTGVLRWAFHQVRDYHPETESLIPIGLVQDYLPTLRGAYSALLCGIGAKYPGALQGRPVRDALSRLQDAVDDMVALLDAKKGLPNLASAMTVAELETVVDRLVDARTGIVNALGWSRCRPRV